MEDPDNGVWMRGLAAGDGVGLGLWKSPLICKNWWTSKTLSWVVGHARAAVKMMVLVPLFRAERCGRFHWQSATAVAKWYTAEARMVGGALSALWIGSEDGHPGGSWQPQV